MNEIEIKKFLYKSKGTAFLNRYCKGKLYYVIRLEDGIYEFPMNTVENTKFITTDPKSSLAHAYEVSETEDLSTYHTSHFDEVQICNLVNPQKDIQTIRLSTDLGDTEFKTGIKSSELIRWITKALKLGELIKVGQTL